MKKSKTLAIMAAGLGTRFGSLKQLHSISSNGYAIIDYSIFDAISVGFNKIVFIVRKEILEVFKERYEFALPKHVTVEFVIQDTQNIPEKYITNRIKPWGTGHALLMLKDVINESFVLINADDFYGRESYQLMYNALYINDADYNYLVSYQLDNTLSENGYVSRGECFVDDKNCLSEIFERTKIAKNNNDKIIFIDSYNEEIEISSKTPVSMNFWGFTSRIFSIAEPLFIEFLNKNINDKSAEFYLANIVDYSIKNSLMKFKMLPSASQWYGITYKEDQEVISSKIFEFTKNGLYPETLW